MNELVVRSVRAGALAVGFLGLAGCASTVNNLPGIYRLDIQQGNVVDQDMVDQLELGMEKRKARFALGTPLLTDTFHEDRWEYLYSYRKGTKRRVQRRITLFFEDDRLVRIDGDVEPSIETRRPEPRPDTMVIVPPAKPRGLLAALMPDFLGDKPAHTLPHETEGSSQSEAATAEDDAGGTAPSGGGVLPTETAAAPDSTDETRPAIGAEPSASTEPLRPAVTQGGEEGEPLAPGSGETEEAATREASGQPETSGTTEQANAPAPDDEEERSFFKRLVDRHRQGEPAEDGGAGAPPAEGETAAPTP